MWEQGSYSPPSLDETVNLVAEAKRIVPPWVRILRIQRDIPVQLIEAGVRKSHLRELVQQRLREQGSACRCIRCREIGHVPTAKELPEDVAVELRETVYKASGGTEVFLSYEVPSIDSLIGYARLRLPGTGSEDCALLRELHVYGQMVPIDEKGGRHWQHRGFGEKLLAECERKAAAEGYRKMMVTSGVGARNYYRKFGYERDGLYMSKLVERKNHSTV